MNRRSALKTLAVASVSTAWAGGSFGQNETAPPWRARVLSYLERHARADHGYAWEDQEQSHLTPTFAVIGCYQLLRQTPPNKAALAEFVRTHHPAQLKKLEQEHHEFEWQQIRSLLWL